MIHTLIRVLSADFAYRSYQHDILEMFVSYSFSFLVVVLATTVSSLVDEGSVLSIKLQHSWKEQLSCSCSVDGPTCTVLPIMQKR